MSFVRWGTDSEIYVYTCSETLNFVCCECSLTEKSASDFYEDFQCEYLSDMIDHVKEHIAAEHQVPDTVIPKMLEHQKTFGNDYVKEKKKLARKASFNY